MKSIIEHANSSESEVCGFIFEQGGVVQSKEARSFASSPELFEIHPIETLKMIRSGGLMGIYHSHIGDDDEKPSYFDVFNVNNCGIPFVIFSKATNKFCLVLPEKVHVKKEYVDKLKAIYD